MKTVSKMLIIVTLFVMTLWNTGSAASQRTPKKKRIVHEYAPAPEKTIPVNFTLDKSRYVTLVIEDRQGKRVWNVIGDTWFDEGAHTLYWDGYDVGMPRLVPRDDVVDMERSLVKAGEYRLRGLTHDGIAVKFEIPIQSPGSPPWHTADGSGAWLSDHSPPADVVFLPKGTLHGEGSQLFVSASIAETGHAFMWLNEEGKKLFGKRCSGFMGSDVVAADVGPEPSSRIHSYSASYRKGLLQLLGHIEGGEHIVLQVIALDSFSSSGANKTGETKKKEKAAPTQEVVPKWKLKQSMIANRSDDWKGLVVYNQTAVASLAAENIILFMDAGEGQRRKGAFAAARIHNPKGLATDTDGHLYVISGTEVLRCEVDWNKGALTGRKTLVSSGLEMPQMMTIGQKGKLFVSDWGKSHQVKVFSPEGKYLHTIGKPGGLRVGPYDEERMSNPLGLAIDSQQRLWVAERTYAPKRISIWSPLGEFIKAYYGSTKYGGGGVLDYKDKTRFYFAGASVNSSVGIEFALDWEKSEAKPRSIYSHREYMPDEVEMPCRAPEQTIYCAGKQYMVNCFNGASFGARGIVAIRLMGDDGIVHPAAIAGFVGPNENPQKSWLPLLYQKDLRALLPENLRAMKERTFYIWSDLNGDRKAQPEEIQFKPVPVRFGGMMYVLKDLSIVNSAGFIVTPKSIKDNGAPVYDIESLEFMVENPQISTPRPVVGKDRWLIMAGGPIVGYKDGKEVWKYTNHFPSRGTPSLPKHRGDIASTARLMNYPMTPMEGQAGEIWGITSDKGSVYLMTMDGLFIADLGGDERVMPLLRTKEFRRGIILDDFSFKGEHFWPTMTQTDDGKIYLVAGKEFSAIFEVVGLETVLRKEFGTVTVTKEMLAGKKKQYVSHARMKEHKTLTVPVLVQAPKVDGNLSEWSDNTWVAIDSFRNISGSVRVSGDRLYAAFKTPSADLLVNSGSDGWQHIFATGGGLDFFIRADPTARPVKEKTTIRSELELPRTTAGDVRIFVTREGDPLSGRVRAVKFRQNGGCGPVVIYESPVRTVKLDTVLDVSDKVRLAQHKGNYEISIPLSVFGISIEEGFTTQADFGVLIGSSGETQARLYWNAGGAFMVSDVPSEAQFHPNHWGTWRFEKNDQGPVE